jgi:Transcriptional regulator, AbiEi antitoxin, Type IV TA system
MVNVMIPVNEAAFEREGLARLKTLLEGVPFVKDIKVRAQSDDHGWDAEMTVRTAAGATPLLVECKRRSEPRLLREMAARFELARIKKPEAYQVLVAVYLSPQSAAICQEYGIGYMDLAGNCHLSFGQIHIHREGIVNPFRESRRAAALFAPKAERVLRALLDPELPGRQWTLRDLAQHTALDVHTPTSVSLGQVHKVVKALCDHEFAVQSGEGVRLVKPEPLLLEWAKNYRFERNKAARFYSVLPVRELEAKLADIINEVNGKPNCEAAFASFSAAARIKPYVRQHRQYLYLRADVALLKKRLELKEVSSGENVVVLDPYDDGVFYQAQRQDDGGICTGPIQTYLDVNASGGRGPEAAEQILATVLRNRWRTA